MLRVVMRSAVNLNRTNIPVALLTPGIRNPTIFDLVHVQRGRLHGFPAAAQATDNIEYML
jgi:hypothetical protein